MEPHKISNLIVHGPLKVQILNLFHIPLSLMVSPDTKRQKESKINTSSQRYSWQNPKYKSLPLFQTTFSLVWAIWTTVSLRVATGDPGISRNISKSRCAGGDATLLVDQVTTYFLSHLFGHGNTKTCSLKLQNMDKNIRFPLLLHVLSIQLIHILTSAGQLDKGHLESFQLKGRVKWTITCF